MIYKDIEADFIYYTDLLLKKGLKGKQKFFIEERKLAKETYKENEKEYILELDKLIREVKIALEISEEKPKKKKNKAVHHPVHYNKGKFEVIDVINDWKLNFELGNVIKYIARAEHKNNRNQDLEKALFYLNYEINKNKRG